MSIMCEKSQNRHLIYEVIIEFTECDAYAFRIADERPVSSEMKFKPLRNRTIPRSFVKGYRRILS